MTSSPHHGGGRLSPGWLLARWPLMAVAVLAALILGFVGFGLYFDRLGDARSATDLTYLTLQLFVLESGSVPPTGAPWQLELARLLAPATTGVAIAVALAAAFREETAEIRLRFQKGHIVVCGLDEPGRQLVLSLLAAGYRVVAVGAEDRELSKLGAVVIDGDPRSVDTLWRARVARASHVIALTDADDTNAEVAIRAGELAPESGIALTCLAHIQDPGLCALLRSEELAAEHEANYRLDFFNILEQGARALLDDHPPYGPLVRSPHVGVIGMSPLGQALVAELARRWRVHPEADGERIVLSLYDEEAAIVAQMLETRYPQLVHVAEVRAIETNLEHVQPEMFSAAPPLLAVYVCIEDDTSGLEAALGVRRCLADPPVPIVVELSRSAGLTELLQRQSGYPGLSAFDLFDRTLQPSLLLGGTYEVLARAIHNEYLEEQLRQGATVAVNPSLVPWEQLPETLKESNRDQAAHIGAKLAAIGSSVAPLSDWDADQLTFPPTTVEMLAEMEHGRWMEQRQRDGWTLGPKDIDGKASPYLVPWTQLSDEVKEWDRRAVRGIPSFLARAGYQVTGPPPT